MSKKILSIALGAAMLSLSLPISAQSLFTIPDTVCVGHEIAPANVIPNAENYSWTFCPPQLQYAPLGDSSANPYLYMNTANGISVVKENNKFIGFVANDNGTIARIVFPFGNSGTPWGEPLGNLSGAVPPSTKGIQAIYAEGQWHVFAIGGANLASSSLVRLDFGNGLSQAPTNVTNLGNTDGLLDRPSQFYIAQEGGNWYAFTFNNNNNMVRLNFGTSISNLPTATVLGNMSNNLFNVGAITAIEENNNWYLMLTDKMSNSLIQLQMGTSLANDTPVVVNHGSLGSRLIIPAGISITQGCNDYYAYVLNNGGSGITTVYWSGSIANAPDYAVLHGNVAELNQPLCMSQFVSDSGALWMFAPNNDNTLSRIYYLPCDNSSIATSNERNPQPFSYDSIGLYTVRLTVNEGTPQVASYCENVYVNFAPPMVFGNDTLLCSGDTATLFALSNETDSFKWSPMKNIDTTQGGRVAHVWPDYTTDYTVTLYYEPTCIINKTYHVAVSQIAADAGPDRILNDGAITYLGGPNTTLGDEYHYNWIPGFFIEGASDSPNVVVRPAYDITYYLQIWNTDGCYRIDSVLVTVPCDDVHLPNAFTPQSPNPNIATFGLNNQRIVKLSFFRIFDRWGRKVFETTDVGGRWDGTVNGVDAAMGVYMWEIDAFCDLDGKRYRKSGNVTLLR